jgi:hypothetical protein
MRRLALIAAQGDVSGRHQRCPTRSKYPRLHREPSLGRSFAAPLLEGHSRFGRLSKPRDHNVTTTATRYAFGWSEEPDLLEPFCWLSDAPP